jgi:hypothetical protein
MATLGAALLLAAPPSCRLTPTTNPGQAELWRILLNQQPLSPTVQASAQFQSAEPSVRPYTRHLPCAALLKSVLRGFIIALHCLSADRF